MRRGSSVGRVGGLAARQREAKSERSEKGSAQKTAGNELGAPGRTTPTQPEE